MLMIFQFKMDPKAAQNWSKTGPRRSQNCSFFMLKFGFNFGPFWSPIWLHFRALLDAKIGPKSDKKSFKIQAAATYLPETAPRSPKTAPRGPKTAPRPPKDAPRPCQEAPRRPKEAPRPPQDHPKRLSERPKTAQNPSE